MCTLPVSVELGLFQTWQNKKKKKQLSFVSLKSLFLKSEAPAGSLEHVDAGDEQWAHLLWPLLQLVCDYDVLHKEYP